MRLVVGLGNPGAKYEWTRHNVGFLAVDEFLMRKRLSATERLGKALTCEVSLKGEKVLFAKPQTFMNLSGQSVRALVENRKIPLSEMIVLHDEADLDPGRLQLKFGGGTAGHNGLESILENFQGNKDFYRLRIGVGKVPGGISDYLLEPADPEMLKSLASMAADALDVIFAKGTSRAISEINRRSPSEKP